MYSNLIENGIILLLFFILVVLVKFIFERLAKSDIKIFKWEEYFPEEELTTLKQVYYLIMILIFFMFIMYTAIFSKNDLYIVSILEVALMVYIGTTLDYSTWKDRILFFLILPFGSFAFILFGKQVFEILDIIQMLVYVYLIIVYYYKFKDYTKSNSLGIAIVLLFAIIFFSFVNTTFSEGVEPLDAIVMVSNAFTSNGYAILGQSAFGKLNSILLVWGGYILSGVGTATLTAAIMQRQFNKRIDKLEELIKKEK